MEEQALVDLYFPVSQGSPEELHAAAAKAHLDAVVYVADHPDDLPDASELARLSEGDGPAIYAACALLGPGYRVAVLVEDWEAANFEVLEATADLNLLLAAVQEMNGCVYAVCPHQDGQGEPVRSAARLPEQPPVGVVAMVRGGTRLGRDLDVEDAGASQRRVLGATGPFGELKDVGRFATMLPGGDQGVATLIARLNEGYGVAVEITAGATRATDDGTGDGKGKRKRRRRRGPKRRDGEGGGAE